MSQESPWIAFCRLARDTHVGGELRAKRIETTDSFLAVSDNQAPLFLVPMPSETLGRYIPSIALAGLEVNFGQECKVRERSDATYNNTYVVFRCHVADRLAHEYFVQMLYPAIRGLGKSPAYLGLRDLIDTAKDLFSQKRAESRVIRGLWGELFLISRSSNIGQTVSYWRRNGMERYDFSQDNNCLEVKTALGDTRQHIFGLGQVRPPPGLRVIVASLLLQPMTGGIRISDLVERIGQSLQPNVYRDFLKVVSTTLDGSIFSEGEFSFNAQSAAASLRFFLATQIPAVSEPIPPEVSHVEFVSDLTNVTPHELGSESSDLYFLMR